MPKKFSMKELLNDTSKAEATETPAADPSGFDIVQIPYDKIKPSKKNFYGLRDIEELAASIDEIGLLHNLVVVESLQGDFYEILSGGRRYEALGLLKWATVPCKVENREKAAIDELKLIIANSTARELTDFEKVQQAARLKEVLQRMKAEGHKFKGRMRDNVAEILNVSSGQMQRYEGISKNLSPEWLAEFEAGNVGISAAYEISTATPEEQAAAHEEYKESGQPPTSKPKQPETPLKPTAAPESDEAVKKRAENMERARGILEEQFADPEDDDPKALPNTPFYSPKRAYVTLTDTDGGRYQASGSLAVIAAIDGEDCDGYISEGEAAQIDLIMLATALVGEIVQHMGDNTESKSALKTNLAALFDGERE